MVKQYYAYINGNFIADEHHEYSNIINPATEEVIAKVQVCTEKEVDLAVAAARNAFQTWRKTTPQERSEALHRLADVVEARLDEFAQLELANTGKPKELARGDVAYFVDNLRFFAGAARTLQGLNTTEYVANHTSMIRREPVGVVASITPWNYPLMMAGWKIGPALAAGNTIVLKPSELTPLTTLFLAELSKDVLPDGVLNVVTGFGPTVGAALAKHEDVQMISLTGSVRAGQAVAANAAGTLKKVHLELGGKAPVLIFDDVNLDEVVAGIKTAGFYNSGQDCTAATRLYVAEQVYDTFLEKLIPAVESIKVGDPLDETTELGPLISADHLERVDGFVQRALQNSNASILTGGKRLDRKGFFYAPTVITGVAQNDEIIQEEVFGPVITVMPFKDYEEAIALGNDCNYGLSASVWTKNIDRAMRATQDLHFGAVWANTHLTVSSEVPHGGFKLSGYGNDQSIYSLEEYTEIKHVMFKTSNDL